MIPLMKVHCPTDIGETLQQVFSTGFVTEGEYSDKFEQAIGEYIGNPNVCLVNSCTSALHLAAHMMDLKEGDEVITTAMTCMATNEPFYHTGATLVFADIDPTTGNIDPKSIEEKITDRTKGIIAVHWGGQPCDMDEIMSLANEYDLKVVEDAAHALRSTYKGKLIGNHGDYVCYSFQAVKHLTTVDGGAIVCKSEEDATRIRKLRWFGLDRQFKCASRWEQDIAECGYKFHMNNINAAIGLRQLETIDLLIDRHIENADYLTRHIDNPKVEVIKCKEDRTSSAWLFSVLVDDKAKFRKHLNENGVATDNAHVNNLRYSVFEKFSADLPGLDKFDSGLMNIPCGWWVSNNDRQHIASVINSYGE